MLYYLLPMFSMYTLYMYNLYSICNSIHTTQNLKTELRTFPRFSRVPQSKFEANRSKVSSVMIRQRNNQKLQLYITRYILWKSVYYVFYFCLYPPNPILMHSTYMYVYICVINVYPLYLTYSFILYPMYPISMPNYGQA